MCSQNCLRENISSLPVAPRAEKTEHGLAEPGPRSASCFPRRAAGAQARAQAAVLPSTERVHTLSPAPAAPPLSFTLSLPGPLLLFLQGGAQTAHCEEK